MVTFDNLVRLPCSPPLVLAGLWKERQRVRFEGARRRHIDRTRGIIEGRRSSGLLVPQEGSEIELSGIRRGFDPRYRDSGNSEKTEWPLII